VQQRPFGFLRRRTGRRSCQVFSSSLRRNSCRRRLLVQHVREVEADIFYDNATRARVLQDALDGPWPVVFVAEADAVVKRRAELIPGLRR